MKCRFSVRSPAMPPTIQRMVGRLRCFVWTATFQVVRAEYHGRHRSLVNVELEYVRSRIVANHVEVVLTARNFTKVQVGGKDTLAL